MAWESTTPLGSGLVRWSGFTDDGLDATYENNAEFCHLQVREQFRGKGVGSLLISSAESIATRRGFGYLTMGVSDDNAEALALYLRRGFRDTGVTVISEYAWVDPAGNAVEERERNHILVKRLARL